MKAKFCCLAVLTAGIVTLLSLCAAAQAGPSASIIQPSTTIQAQAFERTPEQMDAFAATVVAPEPQMAPFRPTIDENVYKQMKQVAAMAPVTDRGTSLAPAPLAPPVASLAFAGPVQCNGGAGCWFPPDVSGAIGKSQFVAVHNSMLAVYSRTGLLSKLVSLNAFFGYATKAFYDPRVQWDETWQRWIVTAPAFAESASVQYYFMAFSQTSSATGKWWIYAINASFGGANGAYDFPMIGLHQDAVLFTANVFTATGFQGSSLFALPKARVYNGFAWSVPLITGLVATMQPAHQLVTDENACAWLAAAPTASGHIYMIKLCNPGNPSQTALYGYYDVGGVGAYSVPPSAVQPSPCGGGTNAIDTSDNRFVNTGTQNGDLFYQAHSINVGGPAGGRYYIIKGLLSSAPTVQEQGSFFSEGTSSDFNVSIAADPEGRLAMTWTEVNAAGGVNARVRYTGKLATDGVISGAKGATLFTSPACLTGNYDSNFGMQRWGDYSQVSVDWSSKVPANINYKYFWIDNETIPASSYWGTEIGKIHF